MDQDNLENQTIDKNKTFGDNWQDFIDKIERGDYLDKWEYSKQEWDAYAKRELGRKRANYDYSVKVAKIISSIGSVIILVLFAPLDFPGGLMVSLFGISLLLGVIWIGMYFKYKMEVENWELKAVDFANNENRVVYIDSEFIAIGPQFVMTKHAGIKLVGMKVIGDEVALEVYTDMGEHSVSHLHFIPIPEGQKERVLTVMKALWESR